MISKPVEPVGRQIIPGPLKKIDREQIVRSQERADYIGRRGIFRG